MAVTQHLVMVRSATRLLRRVKTAGFSANALHGGGLNLIGSDVIIADSAVYPPFVPSPFQKGHNRTLLQRDPTQEQPLRRFTEILTDMINSLVGQGQIVQTGPTTWSIVATGGTGLTGTFP